MEKITLPDNWKTLSNQELFLTYQKKAYRQGDSATVKQIADLMRQRLEQSGLVKTIAFGWIKIDKLNEGLASGAIHEVNRKDMDFAITHYEHEIDETKKINGRTQRFIKRTVDTSRYDKWVSIN